MHRLLRGSTGVTLQAGKLLTSCGHQHWPSLPSFRTTVFTPNEMIFSAASRAETRPRTSSPVRRASSVSLGENVGLKQISSSGGTGGNRVSYRHLPGPCMRRSAASTTRMSLQHVLKAHPARSMTSFADIERAKDVIERADALSTVLEIPLEVVEAALRLGRKAGKLTVLDAGPPRYCPMEILTLADVVSPNETELARLTGEEVRGRVSAREAAEKLISLGVKTVVLKLGSDGSMLVTAKKSRHFPACKVTPVDPTAAGDAFTAALTVELAAGHDLDHAIRFANCAGALAASKLGAQPSLPTRLEVEALAAQAKKG